MKCLILVNARWELHRYLIRNVSMSQVEVVSIYKLNKKNMKYLFADVWVRKCKLPFEWIWYGKWKKNIKDYDTIIVNSQNLSWNILSYIKRKNPKCNLNVWYWDTVDEKKIFPDKYRDICRVWSFDKEDCKKYNMNLYEQFYYPINSPQKESVYDAMFVGRDKGRIEKLNEICNFLQKEGMNIYTYVQRDKIEKGWIREKNKKELEYEEIVRLIMQSKCIIDIPKEEQNGITWRVLEALFYSKKLITTDTNVRNYDFYNRNNIFIWGEDDVEGIVDFVNSEYKIVDDEIKKKYLFEEWVKRFDIENNRMLRERE